MPTYVVAGYGKFGRIAVERVRHEFPDAAIWIVEQDHTTMTRQLPPGIVAVVADAVQFFARAPDLGVEAIVIPTVPFHLAARFLFARIPEAGQVPIPVQLSTLTPNACIPDASNLCCSRADFLCPDDCPEGDLCTVTGELRDPLYLELEGLRVPCFNTVVLRSFQVLPGVGGYLYRDLCDVPNRVRPGLNLIATSCRCHGIITALRVPVDENP